MKKQLYPLNVSQQVVRLQTLLTIYKRVGNIVFGLTFENPLDYAVMEKSINMLFARVDSLRIRFTKKNGQIMQYFADSAEAGKIGRVTLETPIDIDRFIKKFRRGMVNPSKNKTIKFVLAKGPEGKDMLFAKVSHFAADTYGIGIIVNDLMGVYESLLNGTPLPPAPAPFETVLKKDTEFLQNEELLKKDIEFFEDYIYNRHKEHPMYCGIHGNTSALWNKCRKKGLFSVPYQFIDCDTDGYRYLIPKYMVKQALEWCGKEQVTPANFFFYAYSISCSLVNGKAPYQLSLILLNSRATMSEKKCAGTKVQASGIYVTVDYDKSFNRNIKSMIEEQTELYRHTRMSYVDVQKMQHKAWGHSSLQQLDNLCYSFIPMQTPKGVSMQIYSNGKGSLTAYVALMFNPDTLDLWAMYDVQSVMTGGREMADFQNTFLSVIERVLENPDKKLSEIL